MYVHASFQLSRLNGFRVYWEQAATFAQIDIDVITQK
jgi:hypothetical protein